MSVGGEQERVVSGVQNQAEPRDDPSVVTLPRQPVRAPRRANVHHFLAGMAAAQAGLYGLSAFLDGSYDLAQWGPIAVVASTLLLAASIAAPVDIGRTGWAAVGGLGIILVWGLASLGWADSLDRVWTEVARVGFYLVALVTGLLAVRSASTARLVLGAFGVAATVVGLYTVVRCLIGEGDDLFFQFRLFEPLGYSNGEGAFFVMGFWAVLAAAEGTARPAVRGMAAGLAVLLLGLVVLTESRGALVAAMVAATVVLLYRERVQRAWLLLLATTAVAAACPWLLDVYAQRGPGAGGGPAGDTVRASAYALVLVAGMAGSLWGLASWCAAHYTFNRFHSASAVTLVILAVVAGGAGLAALGDPVAKVRSSYHDFVALEVGNQGQRLTSTGGFRYDYWRVAIRAFQAAPAKGLGAGNYGQFYIAQRANPDYLTQPHSLMLQLLAELGVVGALGFLLFTLPVLIAIVRQLRARLTNSSLEVTVAFTAIFATWFVQTNVDWLHNIPAVTGIALLAAGGLIGLSNRRSLGASGRLGSLPSAVLMCVLVLLSGAIGVKWMAERYERAARDRLVNDPQGALTEARRSLQLNPERPQAYFAEAAAFARLGQYVPARRSLLIAADKEPRNYVTWALLGDLSVRRGDVPQSKGYYVRASRLNPFDQSLAALAERPRKVGGENGK